MVSIIVDYYNDNQKFDYFWSPLIHKHHETEFIFVDNESSIPLKEISPKLANLKIFNIPHNKNNKVVQIFGARQASNNLIFITTINYIPTYQTMILLQGLNDNTILLPHIHNTNNVSSSFSAQKTNFLKSLTIQSYIKTYKPTIYSKCGVYDITKET
tara:strand:- start:190 stop:660 length:471 start_codon:yes stop_codon:yes gene_type:complete